MHFTAQDRACMRALGLCIFVHVCTECCVHMSFMLWYVWQSSNCHAHRVACVHAESYLLHSRVWEEFNDIGNGNAHGPVLYTIAKHMLGYYTQLWH